MIKKFLKVQFIIATGFLMVFLVGCSNPKESEVPSTQTVPAIKESKAVLTVFDALGNSVETKAGFFNLHLDRENNKIFGEFPVPDENGLMLRFIYGTGLTAGLGSNPIGLDRGAFDEGSIVAFRRIGNKVVAEKENWNYRASSENLLERKAVRQSFASSFLWATDITETAADGRILVDLTGFLTGDYFGLVQAIKSNPKGGNYSIASDRSFPDFDNVYAFKDNVEIDAFATLISDKPGSETSITAADGRAVTLTQHHSFVRLPEQGYTPRKFDDRTGAIEVSYYDFSAQLDAQIVQKYVRRYRLNRKDPALAKGPVEKPIVFYVDSGAPEQIRQALIEGAMWWADAFDAAGFEDAFRVEVLPEGAHPFDVRYNMIQWTHRQTRGWSYGGGIYDPRTGEMLKANVILGSQRVRQDRMIFEGLAGAEKSGTGNPDDPVEIALSRIRQLSAHEVGHTLGFAHNFAASSNDRASVMDYPAPYIRPTAEGTLDFSNAYAKGIGDWDKHATKWLYAQFKEDVNEKEKLEEIVDEARQAKLRFIGDLEARSAGTAHPHAAVWDNGGDPVSELEDVMSVRRIALSKLSAKALKSGQPVSDLNNVIVPIYLFHRYQVAAVAKVIGGVDFAYALVGGQSQTIAPVDPAMQRRALEAILLSLDPAELDISERLTKELSPPLRGYSPFSNTGETFDGKTWVGFDVLTASDVATKLTIQSLLHPARLSRLFEFHRRDANAFGVSELLDTITQKVFKQVEDQRLKSISNVVQSRYVSQLMTLSSHEDISEPLRAVIDQKLRGLEKNLRPAFLPADNLSGAHRALLQSQIKSFLNRPNDASRDQQAAPGIPPGSPIGQSSIRAQMRASMRETCWHCDPL